jgi:hypothetical protein
MGTSKLKRRLSEEQREWQKGIRGQDLSGETGFLPGVVRGLAEALRIVKEFQKENLCQTNAARRPFTRANAVLFYRACRRAYGRLKQSDRTGAMRALKTVLDKELDETISNK